MQGWLNMAGFKRLYILGAGFSVPAGMPLTDRLLPLVFQKASTINTPDSNSSLGHADILLKNLQHFFPGIIFDPAQLLAGKVPSGFDFERFLTCMGVISAFEEETGNQLDEHGNQDLSYFKRWTASVILECQCGAVAKGLPPVYTKFAQKLKESMVLTFNWDSLLETALREAGVPFQLDRDTYCTPPEILLLKLHGSIDWFSDPLSCFRKPWMQLQKIGGSLPDIVRAANTDADLGQYYDAGLTPWIVTPGFDKLFQVMKLGSLWQMLYLFLQNELEVYIIGFSLRPDDYHTHAIIYPQLVEGAKNGDIKVRVVDFATDPATQQEIRDRFAHVKDCEFWFDGFSEDCLDFVCP